MKPTLTELFQKDKILFESKQTAKGPERIPTGVRNTTVPNPAYLTSDVGKEEVFVGNPDSYQFNRQEKNYLALKHILSRNGIKFSNIYVLKYAAYDAYNGNNYEYGRVSNPEDRKHVVLVRFVGVAPGFVWEKYEGGVAGGGRNTVYVGGKALKLTDFLKMSSEEQDALFTK